MPKKFIFLLVAVAFPLAAHALTLTWLANPSSANAGASYTITARATQSGKWVTVTIFKNGIPVDTGVTGYGSATMSTTQSDSGGQTVAYTAEVEQTNPTVFQYIYHNIAINKADQTISFGNPGTQTYGGSAGLSASASSGLGVGFAVVGGPAYMSGNTVNLTGTGNVTVRASQGGDGSYNPAPNVDQTFMVNPAGQSSVSISPSNPTVAYGTTHTFTASGGGVGGYNWSGAAGGTGGSKSVYFGNVGTSNLYVQSPGDSNYYASNTASSSITVTQANQYITFSSGPPTTVTYGDAWTPTGTAYNSSTGGASGLAVSYSKAGGDSNASIAVGSQITFNGAGVLVLRASQGGNTFYNSTYEDRTITINKANQSGVTVNSASSMTYGDPYTASVSEPPGPVGIEWALGSGSTASGAAINASSGAVTANSTGKVYIKVRRASNANYNASAWTSDFEININPRAITVTVAGSKSFSNTTAATGASASITGGSLASGDTFGYTAGNTSSVNAGTYLGSSNPALVTVTISNAATPLTRTTSYTITYAGSYTINPASQAGVTINSASTTIYGNAYTATVAEDPNPTGIEWALGTGSTASGAAIHASSGAVTANSTGKVSIKARRAGTANYLASAWTSDFEITVNARPITVTLSGSKTYNGSTAVTGASAAITSGSLAPTDGISYGYGNTPSANVNSYSAATYAGLVTPAISNGVAPFTRTGSYAITYAGSYAITQATPAGVTINSASAFNYGDSYTGSILENPNSPTPVEWSLGTGSNANGAAINASSAAVTTKGTGKVYIKARRTGDANYLPSAWTPDFEITVNLRPITVTLSGSKLFDGTSAPTNASASVSGGLAPGDTIGYAFANTSNELPGTYSGLTTATVSNTILPTTRTGSYDITYAGNYVIQTNPINQAALTITGPTAFTYGDDTSARTATYTGGSGTGELTWEVVGTPTAPGATIGAGGVISANGVGTVVVHVKKAADANYFESAWSPNFTVTVNPRAITITLAGSKTYDGGTTAPGASATVTAGTLASGDSVATYVTPLPDALTYTNGASVINATAPTTRTGSYTITYAGSYVINRQTIVQTYTITALTYNGSAQSPTTATNPLQQGATVSVVAPDQTNAATYPTAEITGNGNYQGTLTGVPWTINPATPSGTFAARTLGTQDATAYTVEAGKLNATFTRPGGSPVAADSYAIAPGSATGTPGTNVATGTVLPVGVYTIRATLNANSPNYTSATVDGVWTVTLDSDGDGVPDYIELQIGTDPFFTNAPDAPNASGLDLHRPNQK